MLSDNLKLNLSYETLFLLFAIIEKVNEEQTNEQINMLRNELRKLGALESSAKKMNPKHTGSSFEDELGK